MTTAPAQNPTPGIVISTAQGDQTLDRLAAGLVKDCDGSPAGIADVLERVLSADLVDTLTRPVPGPQQPSRPTRTMNTRSG